MAIKRLLMRRLRELLRLKHEHDLSHRALARACTIGVGTVSEYLARAREAGLGWPLPEDLDDAALEARLFRTPKPRHPLPVPDFAHLHRELCRKGVTLQLLWIEYRATYPEGYGYSRFCELYNRWARKLHLSMRQVHRAGEKVFVDFSGKRPTVVDRRTGEVIEVELFVGALGASGYIYAEAAPSQELPHWIAAHTRMLEAFGGSPAIYVPDNLKSGVTTPCRYEPEINRTYAELAQHYGAVVIPARRYRAKDKAKAEGSVLLAQRWIMAPMRNRIFFSLAELNQAIAERARALNERVMRKLGTNRRQLFEQLDRPALKPLPAGRYEPGEWKRCRVNIDYHVEVDFNYYSVPYQLLHEEVEARFTVSAVEVFFKSRRVAAHPRFHGVRGQAATLPEHMPSSHRAHAEWTPSRIIRWAEKTGEATGHLVSAILQNRPHPEQGYRSCLGILRLEKTYGRERLEAACARATRLGSASYRTVKNILAAGIDRLPPEEPVATRPAPLHPNIRGATYYAAKESAC